jgi:hypothetical protein
MREKYLNMGGKREAVHCETGQGQGKQQRREKQRQREMDEAEGAQEKCQLQADCNPGKMQARPTPELMGKKMIITVIFGRKLKENIFG